MPDARGMEIGGLLNTRQAAGTDVHLRHHLHQTMQMDTSTFGQLSHHRPNQLHDFGSLTHHSMTPQTTSQIFQTNYDARTQNLKQEPLVDDDFDGSDSKTEPAVKNYLCGHPDCGKRFARRSDLGRHGQYQCNDP